MVSMFQRLNVSRFQRFEVPMLQCLEISRFQVFNVSSVRYFDGSWFREFEILHYRASPNSKVSMLKSVMVGMSNFSYSELAQNSFEALIGVKRLVAMGRVFRHKCLLSGLAEIA